jgi:hypothetical protein
MQAKQYLWTPQGDWTPRHPARANVRLAHADDGSAHAGFYSYGELCPFPSANTANSTTKP